VLAVNAPLLGPLVDCLWQQRSSHAQTTTRQMASIPEQAVDARRAAVEEVEKLLQHPEDLKRLPDMLEEYTLKLQVGCA